MSLINDKASLFASSKPAAGASGGSSSKPAAAPRPATSTSTTAAAVPGATASATAAITSMVGNKGPGGSTARVAGVPPISPQVREKKLEEAREYSTKGSKCLQTSVFQWSPDHITAAPYFEMSAEAYKTAGDYENAKLMFLQAAECFEQSGSPASAALALAKGAKVLQLTNNFAAAAKLFEMSARQWQYHGDANKAADALDKAAGELENVDISKAAETYKKACGLIFLEETPKSQYERVPVAALDVHRHALKFFLGQRNFREVAGIVKRLQALYEAFDTLSAMCKMMLATTLLQLKSGDAVEAERTYIQEHLGNPTFLKSQEAAVAEDFINAFKNFDIELLDKARSPTSIMYVDSDFQDFARNLTFMGSDSNYQYGASATAPFSGAAKKAPAAAAAPKPKPANPVVASASAAEAVAASDKSLDDEFNAISIQEPESGAQQDGEGEGEEEDFDALVGGIDRVHHETANDDEINLC